MARIQCTDANSRTCAECGTPFDYLNCTWPRSLYRRRRRTQRGEEQLARAVRWTGVGRKEDERRRMARRTQEKGGRNAVRQERGTGNEERRRVPTVCTMVRSSSIRGQAHYNLYGWSFGQASSLNTNADMQRTHHCPLREPNAEWVYLRAVLLLWIVLDTKSDLTCEQTMLQSVLSML